MKTHILNTLEEDLIGRRSIHSHNVDDVLVVVGSQRNGLGLVERNSIHPLHVRFHLVPQFDFLRNQCEKKIFIKLYYNLKINLDLSRVFICMK